MNREKSIQLYQGFQPKYAHKSDRIAIVFCVSLLTNYASDKVPEFLAEESSINMDIDNH